MHEIYSRTWREYPKWKKIDQVTLIVLVALIFIKMSNDKTEYKENQSEKKKIKTVGKELNTDVQGNP